MPNFYLKGSSTTKEEFEIIKRKFNSVGLDIINICEDYSKLCLKSKSKIARIINESITEHNKGNQPVNLICQSIGCNIGVISASKIKNLKNMIIISPEFVRATKKEQQRIISKFPNQKLTLTKPNLETMKAILLYLRTKSQASNQAYYLSKYDLSIIYSIGDRYVSHDYINYLNQYCNFSEYAINSSNHNPLLDGDDTINKIKKILM